jgi:hypothetical protein
VRGQVDQIVAGEETAKDPNYDPTKDPSNPKFEPVVGESYPAPNGQGMIEYLGVNPSNRFAP